MVVPREQSFQIFGREMKDEKDNNNGGKGNKRKSVFLQKLGNFCMIEDRED